MSCLAEEITTDPVARYRVQKGLPPEPPTCQEWIGMFRELADAYEAGSPGADWLLARIMLEVLSVKREQEIAEMLAASETSGAASETETPGAVVASEHIEGDEL